jgi:transcriptional regulator with XRE-family HTH domain
MAPSDKDPLLAIGRNIERLMSARDISLAELGRRTELPVARIDELVAGDAEPRASELLRIAGGIEVPVSQLLEGLVWEADGEGGGSIREAPRDD